MSCKGLKYILAGCEAVPKHSLNVLRASARDSRLTWRMAGGGEDDRHLSFSES